MAIKGFLGQYEINLDDKGRVRIPSKFKAQMGDESFVISCGSAACLIVYPDVKWQMPPGEVANLPEFDE